jgi:Zn-dependent protease
MDIFVLVGCIVVAILALTIHETAHAAVADRFGDPTARMLGRVTLNPLPHIDPFMTILLPAALLMMGSSVVFGGAKPVPVNLANFRRPWRDNAVVAFAGPASNVVQAFFWSGLLSILLHAGVWSEQSAGVTILQFAIMINAVLFVLNMLPLPPLDGSRIVAAMLGPEARRGYLAIEPIGIFLLLALLFVDQFKLLLWMGVFTLGEWVAGLTRLPISWIPVFG